MEQKFVRLPFDVELAKEITNGTKEGRIVTEHGIEVKIVYFSDLKTNVFCILCVMSIENGGECSFWAQENGASEDGIGDLVLEIPEYMTFKDGDVIAYDNFDTISITKADLIRNVKDTFAHYHAELRNGKLHFYEEQVRDVLSVGARLATQEEKQKLIDALKQSEDPRAKKCIKKLGIEEDPKFNFKPFDKVVVRENDSCRWGIDFFMAYEEGFEPYRCMTGSWGECLQYNEETEKLIMTTKSYNGK